MKGQVLKTKYSSRIRNCLTKDKFNFFVEEFEKNRAPSKMRIKELSEISKIDEMTIMTWFRNRRYSMSRNFKESKNGH